MGYIPNVPDSIRIGVVYAAGPQQFRPEQQYKGYTIVGIGKDTGLPVDKLPG
jgi:hypothetical protein